MSFISTRMGAERSPASSAVWPWTVTRTRRWAVYCLAELSRVVDGALLQSGLDGFGVHEKIAEDRLGLLARKAH
jgi:hypothetical protein